MDLTYDYTGHDEAPVETTLDELMELALHMAEAQVRLDDAEKVYNTAKAQLKEIQEKLLPEKMEALGMRDFTTRQGVKITIRETIRASMPEETRDLGLRWLDENGYGKMTKHDFNVSFKKGDEGAADATRKELQALGVDFKEKRYVHPSTLSSFAKQRLEEGDDLPEQFFNVHRQQIAKVK